MDANTSRQLMAEILESRGDLLAQVKERGLSVDDLIAWAMEQTNLQQLRVVCGLCDLQAQAMLSRYRMLAINRLYQLASQVDREDHQSREIARKACADLVQLELRRAYRTPRREAGQDLGDEASLRAALYGLVAGVDGAAGDAGDATLMAGDEGDAKPQAAGEV